MFLENPYMWNDSFIIFIIPLIIVETTPDSTNRSQVSMVLQDLTCLSSASMVHRGSINPNSALIPHIDSTNLNTVLMVPRDLTNPDSVLINLDLDSRPDLNSPRGTLHRHMDLNTQSSPSKLQKLRRILSRNSRSLWILRQRESLLVNCCQTKERPRQNQTVRSKLRI